LDVDERSLGGLPRRLAIDGDRARHFVGQAGNRQILIRGDAPDAGHTADFLDGVPIKDRHASNVGIVSGNGDTERQEHRRGEPPAGADRTPGELEIVEERVHAGILAVVATGMRLVFNQRSNWQGKRM
jgi:hypothetical protein